ncbi:hypothetical protein [Mycobacterium lepromatosis]|uniref:hypothetical protein n=1 Tax=Mycobacterium lepromatosis TaxID=480418 RepID=UPI0006970382|nr:hypothetical protein [Mycobacterium lepromatosis]
MHRQLTVNQALGYATELRLPPNTSKANRTQILEEFELARHTDIQIDKLSGGQRKLTAGGNLNCLPDRRGSSWTSPAAPDSTPMTQ